LSSECSSALSFSLYNDTHVYIFDPLGDNKILTSRLSYLIYLHRYIPYGALSEVMPYLSRRAIENQSVLGNDNASEERRRAGREIWRRVFG